MQTLRYAILLCALFTCGCDQPGPKTYRVSGTVSYDGTPVQQGDILFIPENPALAPEAGKIADGKFQARAKQGTCRVEITALNIGPDTPVIMGSPVAENFVAARYNRESELTADVSATAENVFEFALRSHPEPPIR